MIYLIIYHFSHSIFGSELFIATCKRNYVFSQKPFFSFLSYRAKHTNTDRETCVKCNYKHCKIKTFINGVKTEVLSVMVLIFL